MTRENNNSEINEGDVVYLKSGSVAMTVEWTEDDAALCIWHDKNQHKEKKYRISSLSKERPSQDILGIS